MIVLNAQQNCVNPYCLTKGSVKKVFTTQYYEIKSKTRDLEGIEYEKSYPTHKDKEAFRICEKCGFMTDFKENDLMGIAVYWLFLVPKTDESLLEATKPKGLKGCIYCGSRIYPPKYIENHITKEAIIKFFVSPTREYLGYYCRICGRTYAKKPSNMTWENLHSQYKDAESVNVLDQQHVYFNKEELQDLIHYDKGRGLVIWEVPFSKVGGMYPGSGADIFEKPSLESHIIWFPRSKAKRLLNYLENRGCKIDRY